MTAGGWRGKPGSLAALDAGRLPFPEHRKCARPGCGQIAVRTVRYCKLHGGAVAIKKLSPLRKRIREVSAVMRDAVKTGKLTNELAANPTFRLCRCNRFCTHLPALIEAWHSPDPAAWSRAVSVAEADFAARPRGPFVERRKVFTSP